MNARDVAARRVSSSERGLSDFTYSVTYSVVEPAPGEKRVEHRLRTRLRDAQVGLRRGHVLVECRIRDRSRRGARLRLDTPCPLPRLFVLTDTASRARYQALLVWQRGCDAGVRLTPVPAEA